MSRHPIREILFCCFCAVLAGCAVVPGGEPVSGTRPASEPQPKPAAQGWWYASFRLNWPEGADPGWHLDPLLAVEVVGPVLERHRGAIALWRFHRRAAHDAAGHRFSFIFYSSPEAAAQVFGEIGANPVLRKLESAGLVANASYDSTSAISRPAIGDTSDRNWSDSLQRAWPHFIMGASQTWLELAREYAAQEPPAQPDSAAELASKYEKVNATLTERWQEEGGHAFLHHLNALFGYQPVIIHERRLQQF